MGDEWIRWQERIVESGRFIRPEVWASSLSPKPYTFVSHSDGGYSLRDIPPMRPLLQYKYRIIMVWLN
jgi:hypothetical protein